MLKKKLSRRIVDGHVTSVYANVTNADRDRPISVFDANLHLLCMKLRGLTPNVAFRSNGSTDKHEILLEGLSPDERLAVCNLFDESSISISDEHHFGSLY